MEALFFFSAKHPDLTFRMDFTSPGIELTGSLTVIGGTVALEVLDTGKPLETPDTLDFPFDENMLETFEKMEGMFDITDVSLDSFAPRDKKKKILLN